MDQQKNMAKLIAVTLSGGNREDVAPSAWRSAAPYVDHYLLVDTGKSAQSAIAAASLMPELSGRLTVVAYPEEFGDESAAHCRTFALQQSGTLAQLLWPDSTSWAMMLDTDEQMVVSPGEDLRDVLARIEQSVGMTWMDGGAYPKERFFRLPIHGSYTRRVHECYHDLERDHWILIGGVTFKEKPKTEEQNNAVWERVRRICQEELSLNSDDTRSWMYLGSAHLNFGEAEQALVAFKRALECSRSDDERGWMAFKAAAVCHHLKDWDQAIEIATIGMRSAPHHPELPWACAFAEWSRGNIVRAAQWADISIMLGEFSPITRANPIRAYARFPSAAREAPWQIRAACYQSMGDSVSAKAEVQRAVEMIAKAKHAEGE